MMKRRSRLSYSRGPDSPAEPISVDAEAELAKAQAIQEVVEHAARFTREVKQAKPIKSWRSRPIVLAAIAIPSFLICLYTFIARPEWVFGPDPAKAAPGQREAHLRFTMFLVAQRLEAYRDARGGQLPRSLLEVGENWPAITYTIVDSSVFELRALHGSAPPIVFRSDGDAGAFLGSSRRHIRDRDQ